MCDRGGNKSCGPIVRNSCGNGPCSGCNVKLDHWNCGGYCGGAGGAGGAVQSGIAQFQWNLGQEARNAALLSGDPIIPASGRWYFDKRGAWSPYGKQCPTPECSPICDYGLRPVEVSPGIWNCVPNSVPAGAVINAYNDVLYVNALYDVGRTLPFLRGGCGGRNRFAGAPPVLNPYTWPPVLNPISDLYRR